MREVCFLRDLMTVLDRCKNLRLLGYQRLKENVTNGMADNHEGIDFYRPVKNPDKSRPLWGENQWPSIPGFKEKYDVWIEKMKTLGLIVMEA
jgi:isopenicillin N synthase-like dioxygenase